MRSQSRSAHLARVAVAAVFLTVGLPGVVSAAGDLTPPTGTVDYVGTDPATQLAELHFDFTDPESGLDHIGIMCDGADEQSAAYAAVVYWQLHDGSRGCSTAYGNHDLWITVYNGDGLGTSTDIVAHNNPTFHLEVSAAVTGQQVTISPVFASDFTVASDAWCNWELRWGNTKSLDDLQFDETFGGMYIQAAAADGGCGPWTFTLPWVPYPQFDVRFSSSGPDPSAGGGGGSTRFMAQIGSSDRHITSSSIPIVQVLPNTFNPVAGQAITYTRYLIGGAAECCDPQWSARLGDGENPIVWSQLGGDTFTFTPDTTGPLFVEWNRTTVDGLLIDAYFDPPVRDPDTVAPTATAPVVQIRPGSVGTTVPISLKWSGADVGWGLQTYQLQRSVNGGSYTSLALATPLSTTASLAGTVGTKLRYRVRAVDEAGHVSAWMYTPTFTVLRAPDAASTALRYSTGWAIKADAKALSGSYHRTRTRYASVTYKFAGRDIAWVGLRSPGFGKAKIYIDGVYRATVDLYAASTQERAVLYTRHFAASATHTIKIVNLGTTGRPYIGVDAFAILK